MNFSSRKLVIGATSVVMLGGAGGAVAATQGSAGSHRQAYIDDVAKRLNVSPSALIAATRAARSDQIDAAVAAGRITQPQAEARALWHLENQGFHCFLPRVVGVQRHARQVKTVLIEDAGHWIQQERPTEVSAALLDFLRGLPVRE